MKLKKYIEKNKKIKIVEIISILILLIVSLFSLVFGLVKTNQKATDYELINTLTMTRDYEYEDYDEDNTVVDVRFINGDKELFIKMSYEEYLEYDTSSVTGYEFKVNDTFIIHNESSMDQKTLDVLYKNKLVDTYKINFVIPISFSILIISLGLILFFGSSFTTYEKTWFLSIMLLSCIISVLFPEESSNGVSGIIIMLLYFLDTFTNILCELLISKQNRMNFIVSVFVEIIEIVTCIVLMYRFATLAVTLFFWLPIDIISFINWSKHKDEEDEEITEVRRLKGYQEVLVIASIVIFTIVVGYFLSGLDIKSDLFKSDLSVTLVAYIDACASAVGIANGVFILLRYKEQWIAWYICSFLELAINIILGQYMLIVLKVGFITNTTYGYIKWTKYIKTHNNIKHSLL